MGSTASDAALPCGLDRDGGDGVKVRRQEMSILHKAEREAEESMADLRSAMAVHPPMWPVTDIRVERRLVGKADDLGGYRWVVAGDFSAWPLAREVARNVDA